MCEKKGFESKQAAKRSLVTIVRYNSGAGEMHVYQCWLCHRWHLGHRRK